MQYGTFIGVVWIACFAGFIGEFRHESLSALVFWGSIASVIMSGVFARRFRSSVIGNALTGGRAFSTTWAFCMQMFLYASILAAAAHYIYFAHMDHGYLLSAYKAYINRPEIKQVMVQMASKEQLDLVISTWQAMTPLNFTFEFFILNLIIGLILSLPIAMIGSRAKVKP